MADMYMHLPVYVNLYQTNSYNLESIMIPIIVKLAGLGSGSSSEEQCKTGNNNPTSKVTQYEIRTSLPILYKRLKTTGTLINLILYTFKIGL